MAKTVTEAFEKAFADLGLDDEQDTSEPEPELDEETPEAVDETPEDDAEEPESSEDDEDPDDEAEDEDPDDAESDDDPDAPKYVVKVDGEEVEVGLDELLSGYQRQGDYTKKTQELAEQRRELEQQQEQVAKDAEFREQVEAWYADRASNPADWVREIAQESPDPTATVARALSELANAGVLDPEFVETFGLKSGEVADRAKRGESEDRLARIEREIQERREAEEAKQQQEALIAEYRRSWTELKAEEALSFDSVEAERADALEVLQYAHDHSIDDLKLAYRAMQWERSRSQPPAEQEPEKPAPDPQVARRKRSTQAIAPRSAGSRTPPPPKAKSDREAALAALERFAGE